jgi:hypothetical protein
VISYWKLCTKKKKANTSHLATVQDEIDDQQALKNITLKYITWGVAQKVEYLLNMHKVQGAISRT